ncbi:MAG TPA: TetR/AcrR family transcriptional regulator [Pirellulales bacterium]|nr:TetR/AcrR family transcriptional regulator [Pirellulales bacterium]
MKNDDPKRGVQVSDAIAAAFNCFARTGLQHTTMEEIARELRRSRPVVYRYFTDKNDAFRKVASNLLTGVIEEARGRAETRGTVTERVFGILNAKLGLAVRLHAASPHHARALLAEDSGLVADLAADYRKRLADLVVDALSDNFSKPRARELADILLALTRGLEDDLRTPSVARKRLHLAVELLCEPESVAKP